MLLPGYVSSKQVNVKNPSTIVLRTGKSLAQRGMFLLGTICFLKTDEYIKS